MIVSESKIYLKITLILLFVNINAVKSVKMNEQKPILNGSVLYIRKNVFHKHTCYGRNLLKMGFFPVLVDSVFTWFNSLHFGLNIDAGKGMLFSKFGFQNIIN